MNKEEILKSTDKEELLCLFLEFTLMVNQRERTKNASFPTIQDRTVSYALNDMLRNCERMEEAKK